MAYVPDPTDPTQPVESVLAQTAAAEFRALKAYIQQILSGPVLGVATPGQIVMFAATAAPPGWLELDGSVRLRSTFTGLWTAVSLMGGVVAQATYNATSWGMFGDGDGATTFTLPDWRGEFVRGWNHGRGGAQFDPGRGIGTHQNKTAVFNQGGTAGVSSQVGNTNQAISESDERLNISTAYQGLAAAGLVSSVLFSGVRPNNVATMYCVKT